MGSKTEETIPFPLVAVTDIAEALTASDRPYKKAMPLEMVYRVFRFISEKEEPDPNLVDLFIDQEVYKIYQKKHKNGPKEKQKI